MRFRTLRIAWSILCGFVCVLLIAVWVRSFWSADHVAYVWEGDLYLVESACGSFRPVFLQRGMAAPAINRWIR